MLRKIFKYKLKRRQLEKLRIIYETGYIHEIWVYNLKISKDGSYSWRHAEPGNRIIDLQADKIISIFVIKQKKVFYWSRIRKPIKRKPKIVIDQFKPKSEPYVPQWKRPEPVDEKSDNPSDNPSETPSNPKEGFDY